MRRPPLAPGCPSALPYARSNSVQRSQPVLTPQLSALNPARHAALSAIATALLLLEACAPEVSPAGRSPTGGVPQAVLTPAPGVAGDPENGRRLFTDSRFVPPSGCGSCHTVRGVAAATGVVGPNLTNIGLRPTLAGDTIPNTPENMARWILDPAAMKRGAAMPKLPGVTEQDARDLTAFLYSQPYTR